MLSFGARSAGGTDFDACHSVHGLIESVAVDSCEDQIPSAGSGVDVGDLVESVGRTALDLDDGILRSGTIEGWQPNQIVLQADGNQNKVVRVSVGHRLNIVQGIVNALVNRSGDAGHQGGENTQLTHGVQVSHAQILEIGIGHPSGAADQSSVLANADDARSIVERGAVFFVAYQKRAGKVAVVGGVLNVAGDATRPWIYLVLGFAKAVIDSHLVAATLARCIIRAAAIGVGLLRLRTGPVALSGFTIVCCQTPRRSAVGSAVVDDACIAKGGALYFGPGGCRNDTFGSSSCVTNNTDSLDWVFWGALKRQWGPLMFHGKGRRCGREDSFGHDIFVGKIE